MKIAIPVDEDNLQTGVCVSFGRAPYFLIYDDSTDESQFLNNPAAQSQGGAGIKAAQAVVDSGASVMLTPRCGENAAEVFHAAKVTLYKTAAGGAAENIRAFFRKELTPLDEIHAGFHHNGGR